MLFSISINTKVSSSIHFFILDIVEEFYNLKIAADSVGLTHGAIFSAIKVRSICKGYIWDYKLIETIEGEIWKKIILG